MMKVIVTLFGLLVSVLLVVSGWPDPGVMFVGGFLTGIFFTRSIALWADKPYQGGLG
jgi:hypothetical protein